MSRSSPFRANTEIPRATSAAAASFCVERGLEAQSATSAPPSRSAMARFAVSVVTCRQAAMRTPRKGRSAASRSRIERGTGISPPPHPPPRAAGPGPGEHVPDGRDPRAGRPYVRPRPGHERPTLIDAEIDLAAQPLGGEVRPRGMTVELDDRVEVFGSEPDRALRDPRPEARDVDRHTLHAIHPLEAVGHLNRPQAAWRNGEKHARLADRLAKDRPDRVDGARGEARPEGQPLDHQRDRGDLAVAPRHPPAGAFDLRLVDVGERIGGHQTVALEELAGLVGRGPGFNPYLGEQR